jgi:hypothetical protein
MATPYYRSPTSVPLEAALLPARLAEVHDEVLWREISPGEIEVATKSNTRIERLRVHSDGTTTPLGTSRHRSRLLKTILFAGLAAGAAAVLILVDSEDKWFMTFFVLLFAASIANEWAGSLARHLRRELGAKHDWHEPTKLYGWEPRTTSQLASVEELATTHSGTAFVSDLGEATIEVVAGRHRYLLDGEGNVVVHEKNRFREVRRDDRQAWIEICTYVPDGG